MAQEWQYQVEQFGSTFKPAKLEEVELLLNEAATKGWELSHTTSMGNGNKLIVFLRRKVESRSRRNPTTWP
jgi:hypothetical protein